MLIENEKQTKNNNDKKSKARTVESLLQDKIDSMSIIMAVRLRCSEGRLFYTLLYCTGLLF